MELWKMMFLFNWVMFSFHLGSVTEDYLVGGLLPPIWKILYTSNWICFSPAIGVKVHKYLNHHSVVEDWHMWHVPTCVGRNHGSSKWPWLLTNPHCWSTRFCTSWYGYNTSHSFEIPAYIYHTNPTSISFNCHSISSGARRLLLIKNILDNNQSSCWWFPPMWKILVRLDRFLK